MTILDLLVLLIIAALAGAIGQALAGYSVGGCITSTMVGFVGAVIGTWIAGALGLRFLPSMSAGGLSPSSGL